MANGIISRSVGLTVPPGRRRTGAIAAPYSSDLPKELINAFITIGEPMVFCGQE
jgi:hypothetical protein